MNGIIGLCGGALCAVCLGAVIKQLKADFFPIYTACAGIVFFGYLVYTLLPIGEFLKKITDMAGVSSVFSLLIKAVGISLLCGLAADICRDFGEGAVANGVENAGKGAIILLSLPVAEYLLEAAAGLM